MLEAGCLSHEPADPTPSSRRHRALQTMQKCRDLHCGDGMPALAQQTLGVRGAPRACDLALALTPVPMPATLRSKGCAGFACVVSKSFGAALLLIESMRVAHAAVFTQSQTLACGLQLLLAVVIRFACGQALRGLLMGFGHA